jgi:hypothetical protein
VPVERTWALLQNAAPSDSASGASGLVVSSPRSRMALISLSECLSMVDLSFISARFLGADDVDEALAHVSPASSRWTPSLMSSRLYMTR